MRKGRMAKVMCQRAGFGEVLIAFQKTRQRTRDLRHLDTVAEARAEMVAFVINENLRLEFQTTEGLRVDDAVAVARPASG